MMQPSRTIGRNAADLWHETSGAVAIEYGLIAALVSLVIFGALVQVRDSLLNLPLQSLIDAFLAALS